MYRAPGRPPAIIPFLIFLALLSIAATPYLPPTSPFFGVNLKGLHLILTIPVCMETGIALWSRGAPKQPKHNSGRGGPGSLYAFIAGVSLMSHVHLVVTHFYGMPWTTVGSTGGTFAELYDAILDNHCQASITADLAGISGIVMAFILIEVWRSEGKTRNLGFAGFVIGALLIVATPFLSVSTTFPAFLAWREGWREVERVEYKKL